MANLPLLLLILESAFVLVTTSIDLITPICHIQYYIDNNIAITILYNASLDDDNSTPLSLPVSILENNTSPHSNTPLVQNDSPVSYDCINLASDQSTALSTQTSSTNSR